MKRTLCLSCGLILLLALLASCSKPLEKLSAAELLDLGEKFLLEQDYKQAAVYFEKLIEIEPKSPRGYIGLAQESLHRP